MSEKSEEEKELHAKLCELYKETKQMLRKYNSIKGYNPVALPDHEEDIILKESEYNHAYIFRFLSNDNDVVKYEGSSYCNQKEKAEIKFYINDSREIEHFVWGKYIFYWSEEMSESITDYHVSYGYKCTSQTCKDLHFFEFVTIEDLRGKAYIVGTNIEI